MTPLYFPLTYWVTYFQGEEVTIREVILHQALSDLYQGMNKVKLDYLAKIEKNLTEFEYTQSVLDNPMISK